jgi:hypothetical protein
MIMGFKKVCIALTFSVFYFNCTAQLTGIFEKFENVEINEPTFDATFNS